MHKLIISQSLTGLNEYIKAERGNRYKAAKLKADEQLGCRASIREQLKGVKIEEPVIIRFKWFEKNLARDPDNVAFAKKFILDSLVKEGVLVNDGQKNVIFFTDIVKVDRKNPRVEVDIYTLDEVVCPFCNEVCQKFSEFINEKVERKG